MSEDPRFEITDAHVVILPPASRRGLLDRIRGAAASFDDIPEGHRDIIFAIADIRAWSDETGEDIIVAPDRIKMSHDAAASLSSAGARALGLPDDVHLKLRTDVEGVLGSPEFRLHYAWTDAGRRVTPKRTGAFLSTSAGVRRIPLWMKRALDLADGFDAGQPREHHWRAIAAFRSTLGAADTGGDHVAMTDFLAGLEVRVANRFSISPDRTLGSFDVVPFSSEDLAENGIEDRDISEANAILEGEDLAAFQMRLRDKGALAAYALGRNSFLVVDSATAPILTEIARVQQSDRATRREFVGNPGAFVSEAVRRHLEETGALEGLDAAAEQMVIEEALGAGLIETREYSARVTGTTIYAKPEKDMTASGVAWLPEVFASHVADAIEAMSDEALDDVRRQMAEIVSSGERGTVEIAGERVEASPERLVAIEAEQTIRRNRVEAESETKAEEDEPDGPIILDVTGNFDDLAWMADLRPRIAQIAPDLPETITTQLREHQTESFDWQLRAWTGGMAGVLNADEQGLGKTLQTIAFLNWLQAHMKDDGADLRAPILIVAPTSLLTNWEREVELHVDKGGFGRVVRLYGSHLASNKAADARGTETASGRPMLDLDWLSEAIEDGRAHRYWFLTTYTTLANYQHSLGSVHFAALVLDEIQNIKNRQTITSRAVEAMNADFRIGLTGTPIENETLDLWTIMDRIAPGALGSGAEFRGRYGTPDEANMTELHARVFKAASEAPAALGIRRLKEDVAKELPAKTRLAHPREMPPPQAKVYDEARAKLASGGPGAALKMLHHIRSVSVHPEIDAVLQPDTFVGMSARLSATFDILRDIRESGERALVFIESRDMQFRFAGLLSHIFGLNQVDIINGNTPISKRQDIVNRFQSLEETNEFDVLILSPRAAGTGLTLTAANHVIHLSRWWNPAVEEQCNDRTHRIGQKRPVTVHIPLAIHPGYREKSFDCLLQGLMQRKRVMARQALWPMANTPGDAEGLRGGLERSASRDSGEETVRETMARLFADGTAREASGNPWELIG